MKALFGISHHSLLFCYNAFHKKDNVEILQNGVTATGDVVLVRGVAQLQKHLASLLSYDCSVYVFDTPLKLATVSSIDILDCRKPNKFTRKFSVLNAKAIRYAVYNSDCTRVKIKPIDAVSRLLEQIPDTCISKIMDFLYKIGSAAVRDRARDEIFQALHDGTIAEIVPSLESRFYKNVLAIPFVYTLKEDGYLALSNAVRAVLAGTSAGQAAKTYNVSAYDIRYLIAWRKQKLEKT